MKITSYIELVEFIKKGHRRVIAPGMRPVEFYQMKLLPDGSIQFKDSDEGRLHIWKRRTWISMFKRDGHLIG